MNVLQRISVRASSLGDDIRQIAPMARTIGFRGIQLDMRLGELALAELSSTGRREVRSILARHDLELESISCALPPDALMLAARHDQVVWSVRKAIESATAISAKVCCIDLGRLPAAPREASAAPKPLPISSLLIIPEPAAPPQDDPADPAELAAWDGVDSVMREIGSIADRTGVVMAIASELSSFASLQRMLVGAECPSFGVDLDPVSVLRDRWDLERVLDRVGAHLRHVRARDAVAGSSGRTQPSPLGEGSTNWEQMLSLLDSGGYGGWIALDTTEMTDRSGSAVRGLKLLKSIHGGVGHNGRAI